MLLLQLLIGCLSLCVCVRCMFSVDVVDDATVDTAIDVASCVA